MSSIFRGYRVSRERFWDLVDEIRAHYYERELLMELARDTRAKLRTLQSRTDLSQREFLDEKSKLIRLFDPPQSEDLTVQLQVFEDPSSACYVFRVLEMGSAFHGFATERLELERIFYDDRGDIGEEESDLSPLVEHFDDCIRMRRYFIVSIIELEDARLCLRDHDTSPASRSRQVSDSWPRLTRSLDGGPPPWPVVYMREQYGAYTELFATLEEAMDGSWEFDDDIEDPWRGESYDADTGLCTEWLASPEGEDDVRITEVPIPRDSRLPAAPRATEPL